jgi:hypothetical protein
VRSLNVPPALGMTLEKARRHMTVSWMVQALVGVNPMGEGLDEELVETSPVHRWRRNERKALAKARRLVVSHYKLGSQATSEQILNICPFIYGDNVDEEACFNIKIFIPFTKTVFFKPTGRSASPTHWRSGFNSSISHYNIRGWFSTSIERSVTVRLPHSRCDKRIDLCKASSSRFPHRRKINLILFVFPNRSF